MIDFEDILVFLFTYGYFIGASPIILGFIGAWYFNN